MLSFQYPIVRQLYKYDTFIKPQILKDILAIGKPVVPDLIAMLEDTIKRPEHYQKMNVSHTYFVWHALFLLQELEATESYPTFLKMLAQDNAYQSFWFSEAIEDFWSYVLKCGKGQWAATEALIMNKATEHWTRILLIGMLPSIAHADADREKQITNFLDRFISSTIAEQGNSKEDLFDNALVKNEEIVAGVVCAIIDLGESGKYLQPKIKEAYSQHQVANGIVDEESAMNPKLRFRKYKNIFEHYETVNSTYALADNSPFKLGLKARKIHGEPAFRQRLEELINYELEERIDFKFPAVKKLYHKDAWLTKEEIQNILEGGKEVGEDLLKILLDIKANTAYFEIDSPSKWRYDYMIANHAFYFLQELKEPSHFLGFLDFLAADKLVLDNWVSDLVLIDRIPEYVAQVGGDYLEEIKAFVKNSSNNEFARTALSSGLKKMAVWSPQKREAIVQVFRELLAHFSQESLRVHSESYEGIATFLLNYEDADVLTNIIIDINKFGARELLPEIKEILEQGFLESDRDLKLKDLTFTSNVEKQPTINIFERYEELQKEALSDTSFHQPNSDAYFKHIDKLIALDKKRDISMSTAYSSQKNTQTSYGNPIHTGNTYERTDKKVGRNDPCPCGSKKKYKKCCLKK